MKILIATKNQGKVNEFKKILSEYDVISAADINIDAEVVEDGETFFENAVKKATQIGKRSRMLTVADDSGLEVDYLNGQPGVYSARFAGEPSDSEKNIDKLLGLMEGVPAEKRGARFVCVLAAHFPDGKVITTCGKCDGVIAAERAGDGGFGYDSVFYVPSLNKTLAQITDDEKNLISHRGRALEELKKVLRTEKTNESE